MIRRAEQYQPVVQLQAGTKVTLVFLEGRAHRRAPEGVRTASIHARKDNEMTHSRQTRARRRLAMPAAALMAALAARRLLVGQHRRVLAVPAGGRAGRATASPPPIPPFPGRQAARCSREPLWQVRAAETDKPPARGPEPAAETPSCPAALRWRVQPLRLAGAAVCRRRTRASITPRPASDNGGSGRTGRPRITRPCRLPRPRARAADAGSLVRCPG